MTSYSESRFRIRVVADRLKREEREEREGVMPVEQ